MTQALSAIALQAKPQLSRIKPNAGAIAFAGNPKASASNAANSNSVGLIALVGLGIAAAAAAVWGLVKYFKGRKAQDDE